jgi:hypothetical protein
MKTTIKDVITSKNWIITKVIPGCNGQIRIDAKTRFWIPDGENFFSRWTSCKYANSIHRSFFGRNIEIDFY